MRVSNYIVVLLLACCLGGLGLLAGYSSFNAQVELSCARVRHDELTRQELAGLIDAAERWFVVSDVLLGPDAVDRRSKERSARQRVDQRLDGLHHSRFGRDNSGQVLAVRQFVSRHQLRLDAAASLGDADRAVGRLPLIDESDRESASVVAILRRMDEALVAQITAAEATHQDAVQRRVHAAWAMALLFLGAMLMLWRWISHAISRPLKVLSLETRQASLKGTLLEKMQSGPAEIVDLSASFSTLLECMEARVRERTKHLADANRELNIARLQAEAASEAKSDFLTNVSHELRTPLASIRASAEILNTYPDEATEVRLEFAEVIQLEAERLSRLIENVLDLGKIESGRLDWNLEQVQIADTLFEVVRAANIDAGGAGIAVTLDVQGELPKTLADRDRLLQLWTNLVGNAVKFSSRGSAVEVVAFRRGSSIVVEVRDEGPGIREADQSIIFERFSQVTEDTLTDKPHGTGLGLAIAKEIADHHQATIQVESEWSVGSTFRVVLPVVSEAELEAVDVN